MWREVGNMKKIYLKRTSIIDVLLEQKPKPHTVVCGKPYKDDNKARIVLGLSHSIIYVAVRQGKYTWEIEKFPM